MEDEAIIELVLNLIGIPSLNKIIDLSVNSKRKTKVILVSEDKKPINIVRVLDKLKNIIELEERKDNINNIKNLRPATIIQGLYNERIVIYGDMPGLLSYVFGEIIALANGLLDHEVPESVVDEIDKDISNKGFNVQIFVVPGVPCVKACHMFAHMALVLKSLRVEIIDVDTHGSYFEKHSNGALPLIIINDNVKRTGSPRNYREIKELLKKIRLD